MNVTWRKATHDDRQQIAQLWDEQEVRFADTKSKVDRPELFYPEDSNRDLPCWPYRWPVVKVVVAVKDGLVVGFRYTECIPEVCIVTGDSDVMQSLGTELTHEAHWAKGMGFRSGWGLIPTKFINAMARFLRKYPHIRPWRSLTPVGIDLSELGD